MTRQRDGEAQRLRSSSAAMPQTRAERGGFRIASRDQEWRKRPRTDPTAATVVPAAGFCVHRGPAGKQDAAHPIGRRSRATAGAAFAQQLKKFLKDEGRLVRC